MKPATDLAHIGATLKGVSLPERVLADYHRFMPSFRHGLEAEWSAQIRSGLATPTFFDVSDLSRVPPLFDFVSSVTPALIGHDYVATHRLTEARLRFVAPFPVGYLNWHVDHDDGAGIFLKLIIYLNDVPLGHGEFCFVTYSHLTSHAGGEERSARMKGYRRYPGRAGTGVAFDTAGIHTPGANNGEWPRETLQLSFARW